MVLAVRAGSFKLEWCRNHPQIWSGGFFLNMLGGDNLRDNFFARPLCFLIAVVSCVITSHVRSSYICARIDCIAERLFGCSFVWSFLFSGSILT